MRYLVGLVLALAVVAAPLNVSAQGAEGESSTAPEPWRHPHDRRTRPEPPATRPQTEPEGVDDETPAEEPYSVDPKLSPAGIRRWHPEAFDPSVTSEPEFDVSYVTRSPEVRKRNKRIAIAVSVTVLAVVGIAVGTAVTMSNLSEWE